MLGASASFLVDMEKARELVNSRIDQLSDDLRHKVNKVLHDNSELAYKEFIAHDTLTTYLEKLGFNVKRGTYCLETSFEATLGEGGRHVVICCEYDALPGIGHACGHNLIATSSMAAPVHSQDSRPSADPRTPAEEESCGGKVVLIDNGAFNPPEDIAAAIMAHPLSEHFLHARNSGYSGLAGLLFIAGHKFGAEFGGKTTHAAGEPWNGTNALDAAVAAYSNVATLRQQIRPDERIHAIIEEGGLAPKIIPDYTRMNWGVRASFIGRCDKLLERVTKVCFDQAHPNALAKGQVYRACLPLAAPPISRKAARGRNAGRGDETDAGKPTSPFRAHLSVLTRPKAEVWAPPSGALGDQRTGKRASATKRKRRMTNAGANLSKAPAIKFRQGADGFIIPLLFSRIPRDDTDANADKNNGGDDTRI
ncbi:Peptidase M20 domain-containing protein 2 [Tolypocladium ophioglossoides CBS 100239]|uniref:Peptidase M20 domain-containing protein 2 n=1 Tax=Tolypocladium ophioglossoides (strain CBS 100239) TaxID=1163406 RepID=A0A0L0N190_TOLOC|nr:Peptidase M20 domain-containing protein 2 [Tolypocladium ophioglossoides CBS 100239]